MNLGFDSISWLGNLNQFVFRGSTNQITLKPTNSTNKKPSYATTNPCWVLSYGFQVISNAKLKFNLSLLSGDISFA